MSITNCGFCEKKIKIEDSLMFRMWIVCRDCFEEQISKSITERNKFVDKKEKKEEGG